MADAVAQTITQELPQAPTEQRSPGRPTKPPQAQVDLRSQQIPTRRFIWPSSNVLSDLTPNIDDVVRDLGGIEVYEKRMMRDSQVHAAVSAREQAVLSHGVSVRPAVKRNDPAYDKCARYAQECSDMIRLQRRPFRRSLLALLRGNITGHKLADLIWVVEERYPGQGPQTFLADMRVKPSWSYRLLADQFDNILFAWPMTAGIWPSSSLDTWTPAQLANLIPIQKFALYIHNPDVEDGNPLGTSILRGGYSFWWDKIQLLVGFRSYLSKSAEPSLKYNQREGSSWSPPSKLTMITDPDTGDEIEIEVEQSVGEWVREQFKDFENSTIAFVPDGDDVTYLETTSKGEVFLNTIMMFDRQIVRVIHGGDTATQDSQHHSRAQGQVGQDFFTLPVIYDRANLAFTVEQQIFARYIEYNYGADEVRYTPIADMGQFSTHDTFAAWQSVAQLTGQGAMYSSMIEELYAQVGLPIPDMDDDPLTPGYQPPESRVSPGSGGSGSAGGDSAPGGATNGGK
jgi:hypothetical protein